MTTVLITGANRGIGLALVRQFAAQGANVIACCREPGKADALKALAASSAKVRIVLLEVGDEASIANLTRELGDQPIDIVINNAGINGTPRPQSADALDADNWMYTMRINALCPMLISHSLRENLKRGTQKKLVSISSDMASTGVDYGATSLVKSERYAYRASKAALNNGMKGLARDWAADGIQVLMVNPGFVQTDMTGARALASPASITAETSARNIVQRIAELTPQTSGAFLDHSGATLAW
jgi:NAD(P)-dependent dehydrogenase (short-subunit alcohol dehydrogenase family)